jgi:hypothetical protein
MSWVVVMSCLRLLANVTGLADWSARAGVGAGTAL